MQVSEYFRVVRARKWLITSAVVVVTLGAVVISLFQPAQYRAEAILLFAQRNTGAAVLDVPQPPVSNFPELELATQADLIKQPQIAQQAINDLGLNTTTRQLLEQLTVSTDGRTSLITVAAVGGTSEGAAAIANAVARAYAQWSRGYKQESIAAAIKETQRSLDTTERLIASLEATAANQGELTAARELYATLVAQSRKLQAAENLETGSLTIVTAATANPVPVSPQPVRNGALGLAVGLVIGLAMAFLADTLDDTVKSAEEASTLYGAPVLGRIPEDRFKKGELPGVTLIAHPTSPAAESYRSLRNNLQFINFERSIKTLLVTSAIPGEGKSSVAANLAIVLAQAGWNVVLVIADFRRPAADEALGLARSPGLSEVLAGTRELASVIQQPSRNLRTLSSGETPPNPSELLGSTAMEALLARLGECADFIIIDTPPLLAVADAAAAARWSDAALVVTREGLTTRDGARRAREQLDGVGKRVIGVVVTGTTETEAAGGGYYAYSGHETH